MMPKTTDEIGREMTIARKSVPVCNRAKFDVEAEDYFREICEAFRTGDMVRAERLYRRWERRIVWLAGDPDCRLAPPCLVRKEGETDDEYRNRCHQAGRWI